jgi:hypothetical protein
MAISSRRGQVDARATCDAPRPWPQNATRGIRIDYPEKHPSGIAADPALLLDTASPAQVRTRRTRTMNASSAAAGRPCTAGTSELVQRTGVRPQEGNTMPDRPEGTARGSSAPRKLQCGPDAERGSPIRERSGEPIAGAAYPVRPSPDAGQAWASVLEGTGLRAGSRTMRLKWGTCLAVAALTVALQAAVAAQPAEGEARTRDITPDMASVPPGGGGLGVGRVVWCGA